MNPSMNTYAPSVAIFVTGRITSHSYKVKPNKLFTRVLFAAPVPAFPQFRIFPRVHSPTVPTQL